MATICDGCKTKIHFDDGSGGGMLSVRHQQPHGDYFRRAITAGISPISPHGASDLDLCETCTEKVLVLLGFPTETLIKIPPIPGEEEPDPDQPLAGALTDDELRELGLPVPINVPGV